MMKQCISPFSSVSTWTKTHACTLPSCLLFSRSADGETAKTLTHRFLTFLLGVSYSPKQTGAWLLLQIAFQVWQKKALSKLPSWVQELCSFKLCACSDPWKGTGQKPDSRVSQLIYMFIVVLVAASSLFNGKGILIKQPSVAGTCWNNVFLCARSIMGSLQF